MYIYSVRLGAALALSKVEAFRHLALMRQRSKYKYLKEQIMLLALASSADLYFCDPHLQRIEAFLTPYSEGTTWYLALAL